MKNKILIGKITSVHGLKGQVKIMSFSDNPKDIQNYKPLFDKDGKEFIIKITSKSQGKNNDIFIANINDINNRNDAQNLINKEIFISRDQLEDEGDNEFYHVDLINLDVIDEKNTKIGKILNVMNYGAGDIIEIEFNKASKQKEKIQMFSFIDEIFPEIDLKKGFIKMDFPTINEIK